MSIHGTNFKEFNQAHPQRGWRVKVAWALFLACVRNFCARQKYNGPMWWRTLAWKVYERTSGFGDYRKKPRRLI